MIVFRSIKPATKFRSSAFRAAAVARANKLAPKMTADMKKPTKTWSTPVEFKTEVKVGNAAGGKLAKKVTGNAAGVSIEVSTEDKRYGFLDTGTKVRFATMTKGFQSKTVPNSLNARRGRGGVAFVNRKHPRPGIRARNFTKIVHKTWQKPFRAEMADALKEGAQKSGHGNK